MTMAEPSAGSNADPAATLPSDLAPDDVADDGEVAWDRQRTVPAATSRAFSPGGGSGSGRGHGWTSPGSGRQGGSGILGGGGAGGGAFGGDGVPEWGKQKSVPASRAFACETPRGGARGGAGVASQWFYKDWAGEHGPRTLVQLTQALQKGYFTPQLLVRKEGTDRWHTLRDVLDLRQALRKGKGFSFRDERQHQQQQHQQQQSQQRHGGRQQQSPRQSLSPGQSEKGLVGASPAAAAVAQYADHISKLFKPGGPEWHYIDMQGNVQGPFSSARMAKWWSNPQYRDHFITLRCRRGSTGEFKLLTEYKLPDDGHQEQGSASPSQSGRSSISGGSRKGSSSNLTQLQTSSNDSEKAAEADAEQLKELRRRVEELEKENEQLRQSNEDVFMLRMQVEQLYRDKANLAREAAELKRAKEGLEELLQYTQQGLDFDDGDYEDDDPEGLLAGDGLAGDGMGGAGSVGSTVGLPGGGDEGGEDEATRQWLEELRQQNEAAAKNAAAGDGGAL